MATELCNNEELEVDAGNTTCLYDSDSDDEDLCFSDDDEDPDYCPPASESDEEPSTSFAPSPTKRKRILCFTQNKMATKELCNNNEVGDPGSSACLYDSASDDEDLLFFSEDDEDPDYCPSASESDEEPSTSLAPSPTKRKRICCSLESSAPAAKEPGEKKQKTSTEAEEERWHDREEEDIAPDPLRFMPARTPGPTSDTTKSWSPLSLFQLFFSASVIQKIVENTNANAAKRIKAGMKFKWTILTIKEFYIFMSVIIFTGLVTLHGRTDYWRQKFPYNFPFPREKMSRNRFEAIMWSLHLSNPEEDEENETKRNSDGYDRLFKIKPLYTEMVNACKAHFQPYQNISIDERMVASKARISIKQYIKNKPTKWGYKLFVLADSSTGYTWNFFVYSGKRQSTTTHGLSYSSVMDLMPLRTLGAGYNLYVDNYYTSPTLFVDLYKKKIGCCGTIRTNRIGYPQTQINDLTKKAERGDIRWIRRGELLFVNWMNIRKVTMCSTIHQAYSNRTINRKVKEAGVWTNEDIPVPDCIVDYNKNMGGVDLSDALVGSYTVRNKTTKWYKTFFFHFMDVALVNSYLLLKELFKYKQVSKKEKPLAHKAFREQLMQEMLEFAESISDTPHSAPAISRHMPAFYESNNTQKRKHCKRCHNAGEPRVKTSVYCIRCEVPLCCFSNKNCFRLWHEGL